MQKEVKTINPYEAPQTPSNEIAFKPDLSARLISNTRAYREDTSLYCTPDFIPPPVCIQTGVSVESELEKSTLFIGSTSISIYLTQKQRTKMKWDRVPIGQVLTILILCLIVTAMATQFFLALLLVIPFTIYGCGIPKNHGMKLEQLPDGFIKILNAHPDFLANFPTKAELDA